MNNNNIPLIIPVYNQLTYTKNLINWWRWYHTNENKNPIFIVDNNSNYKPLLDFYDSCNDAKVYKYTKNEFIINFYL